MSERKPTLSDWEDAVEKQIREAMERGDFDDLPGKGKPLELGENPFTPADWRLAFKMLKDAGMVPDWIEQGKEIRAELQALALLLEQQLQWQRERAAKLQTLPAQEMIAERERMAQARERTCAAYRKRATALNKMIDLFNLKVPDGIPHYARIRIEEELRQFEEACR